MVIIVSITDSELTRRALELWGFFLHNNTMKTSGVYAPPRSVDDQTLSATCIHLNVFIETMVFRAEIVAPALCYFFCSLFSSLLKSHISIEISIFSVAMPNKVSRLQSWPFFRHISYWKTSNISVKKCGFANISYDGRERLFFDGVKKQVRFPMKLLFFRPKHMVFHVLHFSSIFENVSLWLSGRFFARKQFLIYVFKIASLKMVCRNGFNKTGL